MILHAPGRSARTVALALLAAAALLLPSATRAQTEPESPVAPVVLRNGLQLSFFTGPSLNVFTGGYRATDELNFVAQASSWSMPAGLALNIPLWSDAALYLRGGWMPTRTTFFLGKTDSLRSGLGVGEIGEDFTFSYSMFQFDVLFRLIGKMDGERVFVGPSFGFVREKKVRIIETEYPTGRQYLLEDTEISGALATRVSIVIGAEYAFTPFKDLYIIPSLQVDYGPSAISSEQPLKMIMYKFLVNIAWQVF